MDDLSTPTVTGGDFLDLKELAANGPVLGIFRIRSFEEPEMGDYGAYKVPVIADVFIASGPRAGELHKSEKFIGAPTNALRGVKNPKKGEQPEPPTTVVGQKIMARINVVSRKGSQDFVGLDIPSQPEIDAIKAAYAAAGGEQLWSGSGAPAQPAAAAAPQGEARPPWQAQPQPAAAGQGVW